jgi:hypothetical protein
MVSLLISELGKLISGLSPEEAFEALKRHGYLSEAALSEPATVLQIVSEVQDSWPRLPAPGEEMWRNIQGMLATRGLLSPAGREAGKRYVSRR